MGRVDCRRSQVTITQVVSQDDDNIGQCLWMSGWRDAVQVGLRPPRLEISPLEVIHLPGGYAAKDQRAAHYGGTLEEITAGQSLRFYYPPRSLLCHYSHAER